MKNDAERRSFDLDFLYPFFHYRRNPLGYRAGFLFNIVSFGKGTGLGSLEPTKNFSIYPLVFYRNSSDIRERVFAFAPFYGNFADGAKKFFMFPLYLRTESEGRVSTNLMWPLLAFYSGEQEGFRLWPLFGSRRYGSSYTRFALWPFYFEILRGDGPSRVFYKSFFPFYYRSDYGTQSHRTYLWPFFQKSVDPARNLRSLHLPWPIVNFKKSDEETRVRFFPFFEKSETFGVKKTRFFLWPLYASSQVNLKMHRSHKDRFLFALRIRRTVQFDGSPLSMRVDLWPVFSYTRDAEGDSLFHVLSPIESILGSSTKLYRNYAFLWRVIDVRSTRERLWVSALFGMVNFKSSCTEKSFYIGPKMFGYSADGSGRRIRFLFIPVKIGEVVAVDWGCKE